MQRFAIVFPLAVFASILGMATRTKAQTAARIPATQPAKPTPAWLGASDAPPRHDLVHRPPIVHYFSLEHRRPDQMAVADQTLLQMRSREIATAAGIFGYDLSAAGWSLDQVLCPILPNTLMLHYLARYPDNLESRFTALVPSDRGPVLIVPALHRNAATFLPAVKDPRNYALFNRLVPAETAKQSVDPSGKWLIYAVCYAEMVGAKPNVPDDPGLDIALVHAPPSTLRMDDRNGSRASRGRQIQFPDREGASAYAVWTISLNGEGRVTAANVEDSTTFTPQVVKVQEPVGRIVPNPPQPVAKITTPTEQPKTTIGNPPVAPNP